MNANEYLEDREFTVLVDGKLIKIDVLSDQLSELLESYHQAKSKEEAEERLLGYVDYMIGLTQYIELLKNECDDMAVIAHVHGWRSSRAEKGKDMRAKLNGMAKELLLPAPFGKEEI